MTVTESLRTALLTCGESRYAVSLATGIPHSTLWRFVTEGRALRGENIDKLADYLNLELRPKKGKRHHGINRH